MRYIFPFLLLCFFYFNVCIGQSYRYKNETLPVEERVQDLLQRMTLEEKVGQLSKELGWEMYEKDGEHVYVSKKFKDLIAKRPIGALWATLRADPWTKKTLITGLSPQQAAKAINALQKYIIENTRLGIPLLISEEVPHGHMAIGATVFPTAIGQASTWNPKLLEEMASVIAKETYAVGGRNGYGPVLDLARDPRWSRTEESYGEDAYLVGKMGEAVVKGLQGQRLGEKDKIMSTLKHFVAYGVPEGGHNGGFNTIGERELRHHFLKPFESAVRAGAGSIMTAYNSIDGIPCSSNEWLLKQVLRKEWGFQGFVVSDLLSISGLQGNHRTAASGVEAATQSIQAGLDMDLSGVGYGDNLLKAIKEGKVSMQTLDSAVANILRVKFKLGLFENPYVDEGEVLAKVGTMENREIARQVAQESIVLLKNENNLLPLKEGVKHIAVIGPNADNIYNQLGDYTAPQPDEKVVTVLDGIRALVGDRIKVQYEKGCAIRDTQHSDIENAKKIAKQADIIIAVMGGSSARDFRTSYEETGAARVEQKTLSDMESGEGYDRATLDFLGDQLKLLKELHKLGKPIVLVTIKGRPLNLSWAQENIPAIVEAWYPGQEGGMAIAEVLFGKYNPAGRLPISVPRSDGQLPVYYNHNKPKHHDYIEMEAKPLYPFGYGLSFSHFTYQNLKVNVVEKSEDFECTISFEVSNTSDIDGDEVVQVYVVDEVSSVVTAVKQLKAFERRHIKAHNTALFSFNLRKNDLKLWGADKRWKTEKGSFKVLVGKSSEDIQLEGEFSLSKDYSL